MNFRATILKDEMVCGCSLCLCLSFVETSPLWLSSLRVGKACGCGHQNKLADFK